MGSNVERLLEKLEAEANSEYAPVGLKSIAARLRTAFEADREEGIEGYEERWVVPEAALKGHMLRGPCPAEGWVKIYVPANVEETWCEPALHGDSEEEADE